MDKNNVLVVTNYYDNEQSKILSVARKQMQAGKKVTLLRVIPNIPAPYFQIPQMVETQQALYYEAMQQVLNLSELLGISSDVCWVQTGITNIVVKRLQKQLKIEDVVVPENVKLQHHWFPLHLHWPFKLHSHVAA